MNGLKKQTGPPSEEVREGRITGVCWSDRNVIVLCFHADGCCKCETCPVSKHVRQKELTPHVKVKNKLSYSKTPISFPLLISWCLHKCQTQRYLWRFNCVKKTQRVRNFSLITKAQVPEDQDLKQANDSLTRSKAKITVHNLEIKQKDLSWSQ